MFVGRNVANKKVVVQHPPGFFLWLNERESLLGLNDNQLAIRAEISNSVISKAKSSVQPMGWDACDRLAKALGVPSEEFMRRAGLLPTPPQHDPEVEELVYIFRQLKGDDRRDMLDLALAKITRVKRGQNGEKETRRR